MSQPTIEQLQEQIQQLEQRLYTAQKNAALGELLGTTTHEFNNILMTVINYARMGLRHKDDATRDKALTRILDAGERAAKITRSVLGMARNRSGDFGPVNLEELISETMLLMERELTKYRVTVEYEFGEVPPVHAIGNQLQQVILNLIVNARQAMPEGGRLVLRTSHDVASGIVDLAVRDHGCGMSTDQLQRIFEPGYSTKSGPDASGKGGTGLGLCACHKIIMAHGGKIRVESTPGKGTAFTIRLKTAKPVDAASLPSVDIATMTTPVDT